MSTATTPEIEHANEPRDGETLADYVNRVRPKNAPVIKGLPVWSDRHNGWNWMKNDWNVTLCDMNNSDFCLSWQQGFEPDYWYDLYLFGERMVSTHDDPWEFATDEQRKATRRRKVAMAVPE